MNDKKDVFRHLILQAYAVVAGRPFINGKLMHFRHAIATKSFKRVVRWIADTMKQDLFSTLHRIQSMEIAYTHGQRQELVVQCCLVFEMCNNARLISESPVPHDNWMFEDCHTLEDIALLRFRLRFISTRSFLRPSLDENFEEAVLRSLGDQEAGWEGLLLILREASPHCGARLLNQITKKIEELPNDVPKLAACLLLSFVSDAIYYLSTRLGDDVCYKDGKFIMRLLDLGASPMITRKDHVAVFERLRRQHPKFSAASWVEEGEHCDSDVEKDHPTALNKLLAQKWEPQVLQKLSEFTCCIVDALGVFKPIRNIKVLDLRCLAARRVPTSDMTELSSFMKLFVSKHRSCPSDSVGIDLN